MSAEATEEFTHEEFTLEFTTAAEFLNKGFATGGGNFVSGDGNFDANEVEYPIKKPRVIVSQRKVISLLNGDRLALVTLNGNRKTLKLLPDN